VGDLKNQEDTMISSRLKMALAVFLFLAFSSAPGWTQMPSKMDADSAAIKQCVAAWEDAWNHHDAHATAMRYVEDGDFSSTTGVPSHGSKELEAHYNEIFTTFLKDAHRTDTVRSIRFFTPELAAVDADTVITGTKAADGSVIPVRKGLMVVLMVKENGHWFIGTFHESEYPAPRPGPAGDSPK
jgi:uncharacterized protein (TIGR02246 family)